MLIMGIKNLICKGNFIVNKQLNTRSRFVQVNSPHGGASSLFLGENTRETPQTL